MFDIRLFNVYYIITSFFRLNSIYISVFHPTPLLFAHVPGCQIVVDMVSRQFNLGETAGVHK